MKPHHPSRKAYGQWRETTELTPSPATEMAYRAGWIALAERLRSELMIGTMVPDPVALEYLRNAVLNARTGSHVPDWASRHGGEE